MNKVPVVYPISGGRDSTAMLLKSLDMGVHIDHIVFYNTMSELPMMYEYIERVNRYLMQKYGKFIVITNPLSTFEHWCFGKITKSHRKGWTRGLPMMKDPCYWKRESKVYPYDRLMRALGIKDHLCAIGYVKGEEGRIQKDPKFIYPLIEWGWCEGDVDIYLESIDMVNPLYKYFSRTGCGFCPYQSLQGYYMLWKFFKKTWRYMKSVERRLKQLDNVQNNKWRPDYSLRELEIKFTINKDGKYSDEPLKACICAM